MRENLRLAVRGAVAMLVGALLTAGVTEVLARVVAPEQRHDSCAILGKHLAMSKPNCVSAPMKIFEGPWMRDTTNDCGLRTAEPCGTRPPRGLRVALLGTSIAHGYFVPYDETFPARAAKRLTRACGRPVEFQNFAFPSAFRDGVAEWANVPETVAPALALRPDVVVLVMAASDLEFIHPAPPPGNRPGRVAVAAKPGSMRSAISELEDHFRNDSRIILLLRELVYRDQANYATGYFGAEDQAAFLRLPFSPNWRLRLNVAQAKFDAIAAEINARHVPWMLVFVPTYGQSAWASLPPKADVHPYALANVLRRMVEARGGRFADLTGSFVRKNRLAKLFYIVSQHPNGAGDAVIGDGVAAALQGNTAAFAGCVAQPSFNKQENTSSTIYNGSSHL